MLGAKLEAYEGIQKVSRPTQLTTRYADRILSHFNTSSCN